MALNDAGKMIEKIWHEIPNDFTNIHLHKYITMPNHIHGIIEIAVGADSISAHSVADSISAQIPVINEIPVGAHSISAQKMVETDDMAKRAEMDSAPTPSPSTQMPTSPSTQMPPPPPKMKTGAGLPQIIQSFKRHTTIEYIKMVKQNILPVFNKRIWQRNYWEHIIRNENEFIRISEYIRNNPMMWNTDKLNGGQGNVVMESSTPYNEENWMV
ncbi:transposase [Desulfobacula sp.]